MVEDYDRSGINSLGGFVFQIDTFIYYALNLNSNESLEYETIEDVSIRKQEELDKKEDSFRTKLITSESYKAIQVKRKDITKEVAERVLMNWILLENSDINIDKYILWGDSSYSNHGNIKNINNKVLYEKIKANKDRSQKSIAKQLKDLFAEDYEKFNTIISNIKSKYEFIKNESITDTLIEAAKDVFHKDGVFNPVYIARIDALRSRLSFEILQAIKNKTSYKLDYITIRKMIVDITNTITNDYPIISFADHKKLHPVHINEIEHLREVQQLRHCKLSDNEVIRRMFKCNYYYDYQFQLKEQARISEKEDIETTAFDNFENVKEKLSRQGRDDPYERLTQTEDKENSSCHNEHLRNGVCIYLTKDSSISGEKQISWKDDANEES